MVDGEGVRSGLLFTKDLNPCSRHLRGFRPFGSWPKTPRFRGIWGMSTRGGRLTRTRARSSFEQCSRTRGTTVAWR